MHGVRPLSTSGVLHFLEEKKIGNLQRLPAGYIMAVFFFFYSAVVVVIFYIFLFKDILK
jgi:hypothetical protein